MEEKNKVPLYASICAFHDILITKGMEEAVGEEPKTSFRKKTKIYTRV